MDRLAMIFICSLSLFFYWAYGQETIFTAPGPALFQDEPQEGCPCSCLHRTCEECDYGSLWIDLMEGRVHGELSDVTVITMEPPDSHDWACNYRARVKATFQPPEEPLCHDVLKIEMQFEDPRDEWMFNFGDSISNDGHGGDYGHQYYDAEMDAYNGDVRMWASDKSGAPPAVQLVKLPGAVSSSVNYANVSIADGYFKFKNNLIDTESCHPWLYALNGQSDPDGPDNYDVYLAFNRVVYENSDRKGTGTCSARISWACPCEIINQ